MRGALAYLAAFVGVCGHASSEFVAKLADTPGPEFSVWRFLVGGIALVILSQLWPGARDLLTPLRKDGLRIATLACGAMALSQLVFHYALDFTSVIQVATVVTAIPIFFVLIDRVVNGTPLARPKIISGIGAFLGVVLLLTNGFEASLGFKGADLLGTLLALGSALGGGIYLVLSKPLVAKYGPIRMTTYTFGLGFFFLWAVVGVIWGAWVNPLELPGKTPTQIAGILTIGIWNTCIGFALWIWGVAAAPDSQRANYLFFLKPVIAALLAIVILGDPLSLFQGLAIFAICFCVSLEYFWTSFAKRKREVS